MRRAFLVLALTLLVALLGASRSHQPQERGLGLALQQEVDSSGIRGRILFLDTGGAETGLIVSGRARGLDPAVTYISLVYDVGSVAIGPNACLPTSGILDEVQMFVGVWQVGPSGNGRLFAQKAGPSVAQYPTGTKKSEPDDTHR